MPSVFNKIALVGMMGSGKTTLGRLLASRLGWEFVDVDTVITDRAGMAIPDIFRQYGEGDFRRREEEAVRAVISLPGQHVVATGGGAFCRAEVRECLLARSLTVFIKVEEDALLSRLAAFDPAGRPMLAGDWRERASALLRERYPVYELARTVVPAGDEPPGTTLERLLKAIGPEVIGPESLAPPPANTATPHGVRHA